MIEYVTLVTFFMLGFGFLLTGILMLRSLKSHFPNFYQKMGCAIFAATFLLAIPLEIRACNWFLQSKEGGYFNFYQNHFSTADALYAILSTIVPVVAQLGSLIFGAIRRRKVQEEKRESLLVSAAKQQNTSGSGELVPADDSNSSETSVSNLSIFDPPIEQYKFNYYQASMNQSSVESTNQPNGQFRIVRRLQEQ